jgi:hypothetical protein
MVAASDPLLREKLLQTIPMFASASGWTKENVICISVAGFRSADVRRALADLIASQQVERQQFSDGCALYRLARRQLTLR